MWLQNIIALEDSLAELLRLIELFLFCAKVSPSSVEFKNTQPAHMLLSALRQIISHVWIRVVWYVLQDEMIEYVPRCPKKIKIRNALSALMHLCKSTEHCA